MMKLNLYNNFLEILHSDTFWVAVAFFIFIAISFKKGKELILQGLDKKIEEIVDKMKPEKIKETVLFDNQKRPHVFAICIGFVGYSHPSMRERLI